MALTIRLRHNEELFHKAKSILEKELTRPDSGFSFDEEFSFYRYSDDKRTSSILYFEGKFAYLRIPTSFTNPTIEQLKLLIHEEMQVKDE